MKKRKETSNKIKEDEDSEVKLFKLKRWLNVYYPDVADEYESDPHEKETMVYG
jgi:hypothetical protein